MGKVKEEIAAVTEKVNEGLNFVVERRSEGGMIDSRSNYLNMFNNSANSMMGNYGMGQLSLPDLNANLNNLMSLLTGGNPATTGAGNGMNLGLSLLGGNPITSLGTTGGAFGALERNLLNYTAGTSSQFGAIGNNFGSLGGAFNYAGKIGHDFSSLGGSVFGGGLGSAFQSIAGLF